MQATQSPAGNDPHDVLEIAPDIVLVARAEEELSKLARDAKARAPELPPQPKPGPRLVEDSSVPSIDTGFRATAVNRGRPPRGGRAIRGFFGVMLAIFVGGAVLTLKVSGDVAQQVITAWIPAFAARSEPPDNPAPQEQSAAAAQPAATAAVLPPVQPADATTQNGVAPAAAATTAAPDQAQMLQSMAHHLANLRQEVDSLRGQLAELRASQEQMSRDMEKAAEQKDRMKLSALPARPAAPPPPPRRAMPSFRPSQAAAAPMAPPPAAYVPPPQAAAPYTPPPPASTYPPPQAAPQTAYDPNAPRPPLPVRE
jgi:hypothetical protein